MSNTHDEQIYSSLMDATPDCVKVLDLNGKVLHMNTPGLCAMDIDNFSDVVNQDWSAIWPADARFDIEQSLSKAVKGEASTFEAFCPTVKGVPKWWNVSVCPVRDSETGRVQRLLSVSRDITHRKDAEQALQLSEARLAKLHQIISSPKLDDPDMLARLLKLGIDEFELETAVIAQISNGVYTVALAETPDESISVGFSCDALEVICVETLRRNSLLAIESLAKSDWHAHPAHSKFGAEIYFGMPLLVEGQIFGTLCYVSQAARVHKFTSGDHEFLRLLARTIGTEMTRQKSAHRLFAAEAEFRAIFELSPVGMTQVSGSTGEFLRVNPKFCELIGYTAEELTKLTPEDITHVEDRAGGVEARAALLAGEIELYEREKRYIRKDGLTIWVQVNATLLRNSQGEPDRTMTVIQDITQRRLTEDNMRESKDRLQLAIRAGELGIWETNGDTHQRIWSPEAMHLFGLDLVDGVGHLGGDQDELLSLIHLEDRHLLERYHHDLGEKGSIKSEYRIVLPKAGVRWIAGGALVLTRNTAGLPIRTVHIAADITVHKQAAEQLRESGEKYRALFESMNQGYCVIEMIFDQRDWAVDYRFIEVNPAFERHTRLVGATGQTIRELVPNIEPHWAEMYGKVARTGEPIRFVDKSNAMQSRWFDVYAFRLGDQNSKKVAVLFSDVSEQKLAEYSLLQSEERFRHFANSIPQLAWIADAGSEGKISWFNKVAIDFTGCTQEQLQESGWQAVIHPEHVDRVAEKFVQHVKNNLDWEDTFPLRHSDGEYRWFLSRMNCIRDKEGNVKQLFGTNTDVTRERELEGKLRQVAAELSEAHQRKDEFLATLAHELRNPLAPIRNGLQLMKLLSDQPEAVEQARSMMERQLTHMVRLVDDLMDASRISQGKLELRKQPISIAAVLSTAIESSGALIEQKRHQLIVKQPKHLLIVDADLTRLAQVFQNLLNNSAKYTEQDGQINVTVEDKAGIVSVSIMDNGVGISIDQLPRIFDMFTQVDRSLDLSEGGLGIGLSLVKRLVDMHGGSVKAKSAGLGKGSEFIVTLPLVSQLGRQAPTKLSEGLAESPSSLRILVVDDNRDGADSLSEMLELMGNVTRAAYDGQHGVNVASEFRPDVILFDIGMPKLNGYEACELVRQQRWGKNVVLIAITGWGHESDKIRTRQAGFDHHLVKPVDPEQLMLMLSNVSIMRRELPI